ncbi:Mismatch repair protein msh3 [Rhizophlyctis rosea]|nr:Mismatch repair protein msh3 [Rhizophlyctis rosea]
MLGGKREKRKASAADTTTPKKSKTSAATASSSQQRTISSFFAPKGGAAVAPTPDANTRAQTSQPASQDVVSTAPLPQAVEPQTPTRNGEVSSDTDASPLPRARSSQRRAIIESPASDDGDLSQIGTTTSPAYSLFTKSPTRKPQPSQPVGSLADRFKFQRHKPTAQNGHDDDHPMEDVAPPLSKEKQRLRNQFIAKFALSRTSGTDSSSKDAKAEDDGGGGGSDYEDPDEGSSSSKQRGTKRKRAASPPTKRAPAKKKSPYTPLEQQFLEIKAQNPDVLLLVEVGYKFRFFGEDAKIAAKELNIVAYMDHAMYTAGIPTHRLHVHVKKLVQLGYKVGVVRQMETAALKAVGDNKSGPFVRKLSKVYTKGTFVDDMGGEDDAFEVRSSYLMCLSETVSKSSMEKSTISIVAVQLSTGDVIFDEFEDGFMRNELETRLLHVQPTEIILSVERMSEMTEKVVRNFAESFAASRDKIRIERLKDAFMDHSEARKRLTSFYGAADGEQQDEEGVAAAERYSQALSLPRPIIVCLSALLTYLKQFSLEHVLRLTKFFTPFATLGHMTLNANTLTSLEVFRNETDYEVRGSLFWVLDQTKTMFGRRMLRKWCGRPLVRRGELEERVEAVEELIEKEKEGNVLVLRLKGLLCQLPALEKITSAFGVDASDGFHSPVIKSIMKTLPKMRGDVMYFKGMVNEEAARAGDKIEVFGGDVVETGGRWGEVGEFKEAIVAVEDELRDHLRDVRKEIKRPSTTYATVAGIEYLIEVPNSMASKVPREWVKISGTKAMARFHTPFVIEKIKERDRYREQLAAACEMAYSEFLGEISEKYEGFRNTIQAVATADCLVSLATVSQQPGYCKPEFVDGTVVEVKEGRHPMVEQLMSGYVDNDVDLDEKRRCLLITGPNMGGKSSYIRMVALMVIMGQIGCYVPATSARLGIFDAVYTRMGASDDITRNQSTFMKELQETSDLVRQATERSLVILDELGRGTSTHDGTAIAWGALKYLVESKGCCTLFVTHYPVLGKVEGEYGDGRVRNFHMGFMEGGEDDTIVFLYKLTPGLAHRSYGLNVARLAGLPGTILETAAEMGGRLEEKMEEKGRRLRRGKGLRLFRGLMKGGGVVGEEVRREVVEWVVEGKGGE